VTSDIYCYHEDLRHADNNALLQIWVDFWKGQGWKAHVLGIEDAKKHPGYQSMVERVSAFPTLNDRAYEISCFVRWLAFAGIDGKAVVTDSDVYPRVPYPPRKFPGFYNGDRRFGTGWIAGTGADFQKIVDIIMTHTPTEIDYCRGNPHVADLTVLFQYPNIYDRIGNEHVLYSDLCWDQYSLMHFGGECLKTSLPRSQEILQFLNRHFQ